RRGFAAAYPAIGYQRSNPQRRLRQSGDRLAAIAQPERVGMGDHGSLYLVSSLARAALADRAWTLAPCTALRARCLGLGSNQNLNLLPYPPGHVSGAWDLAGTTDHQIVYVPVRRICRRARRGTGDRVWSLASPGAIAGDPARGAARSSKAGSFAQRAATAFSLQCLACNLGPDASQCRSGR